MRLLKTSGALRVLDFGINSNIEIIQRFQNKYLRIIVNLDISPMILYTTISTYHMLETRLTSSIRDTPDWRNTSTY